MAAAETAPLLMYKAILFDLGRVLIHFDFRRGYQRMEPFCRYSAAEIPKRLAATSLPEDFETGRIEPHDFAARMAQALGFSMQYDEFCAIWNCIFTEPLLPDSLLEDLASRYRLVLMSNTNAIHFPMVEATYPILRHFHARALSYEVKAMKPNRAIYERAVALAGCAPGECFYTDDIAEYVSAARELGIDAEQFRGADQLLADLRSRGIL